MKNCFLYIVVLTLTSILFYGPVNGQFIHPLPDSIDDGLEFKSMDSIRVKNLIQKAWKLKRKNTILAGKILENSLVWSENLKNQKLIAEVLVKLGVIYRYNSQHGKAMDAYVKALKIYEELNDSMGIGDTYNNIGILFKLQLNYPKALSSYQKALQIREAMNDTFGLGASFTNIGNVFLKLKNAPAALEYYNNATVFKAAEKDSSSYAMILSCKGTAFEGLKNYDSALYNYDRALQMFLNQDNTWGQIFSINGIGNVQMFLGNPDSAISCFNHTLKQADEFGFFDMKPNILMYLSQAYEVKKDYSRALWYLKAGSSLSDSLMSSENRKIVHELTAKYENEQKESQISVLEIEKKTGNEIINKQRWLIALVILGILIFAVFALVLRNKLKLISEQKTIIEVQKKIAEVKHKEVKDSILYARRIQKALLKSEAPVSKHLPDHFIYFRPKDIVSGDFYWALEKDDYLYMAAADCTGHGVPGAFLTMLGTAFLNEITAVSVLTPAQILDELRALIISTLSHSYHDPAELGNQNVDLRTVKDGMDISLIRLNLKTSELQWAGAYNPFYLISSRKYDQDFLKHNQIDGSDYVYEIKADPQPIGMFMKQSPFTNRVLQLNKSDQVYLFSDGFADQFGGPKGKKFKYKQFQSLLFANRNENLENQKLALHDSFEKWIGKEYEQIDDVVIIGLRI